MFRKFDRLDRSPSRRRPSTTRLAAEPLEDRTVPAGNVTADFSGGILTLIGDNANNSIKLLPGGGANQVVVKGVGTSVNGGSQQVFADVVGVVAHLLDGNDTLRADGLVIAAPSFAQVFVDGNAGNDRIEFIDSSIHAVDFLDVQVYGERVFPTFASGTVGNDTIRFKGTSLTSQAFISVKLYGDTLDGGVLTGGNDAIAIVDSVIAASGGFFHQVAVEIYGDVNTALGGVTGTVGGGNDTIDVTDSTISATSTTQPSFGNQATLTIVGDVNDMRGFDPNTQTGADAAGVIGGGNDSIDVKNSSVLVAGENFGTSQTALTIVGDRNYAFGSTAGVATSATIGGGNDAVKVVGSTVSSTGAPANGAFAEIRGDDIQVIGPAGANTVSTIGGGSDAITVRDSVIEAAGEQGDAAALTISGDSVFAAEAGVAVIGGGNDDVKVRGVSVPGDPVTDFGQIRVDSGTGNDDVAIVESAARFFVVALGDGDDDLKFNANAIGGEASLDGGLGHDRIRAHDNTGLLIWFGFEDEHVTL